jgi:hypothetical protein
LLFGLWKFDCWLLIAEFYLVDRGFYSVDRGRSHRLPGISV